MISCVNNLLGQNVQNCGTVKSLNVFGFQIPSFKGVQPLEKDTAEISSKALKTTIKDLDGNDTEAVIVETQSRNNHSTGNEKKFELFVNGEYLGFATVRDNLKKDKLNLIYLYTEEHKNRHYKGAGTELLKCAVNESMKRGYNGKVYVQASHSGYSPLAFYYKNNFVIKKPDNPVLYGHNQLHNASIQYAVENNIPINKVLSSNYNNAFMELDETGAKALLDGKRLYLERPFIKVNEKEINGNIFSANLVKSPNENEYFVQIANEDDEDYKSTFVATVEECEKDGKKHFKILDLFAYEAGFEEDRDFALETIEQLAKEKGYEETTVSKNIDRETRAWRRSFYCKYPEE